MRIIKSAIISIAILLLFTCSEKKKIIPGTSLELAVERKNNISNLKYALYFDIPRLQKDSIPASVTIRFDLKNTSDVLQLDFNASPENIKKVNVNEKEIKTVCENEHLLIDKKYLKDGANAVTVEFIAGEKALNRNPDYLYIIYSQSCSILLSCF
jgi:aminopeptidase N